MQTTPLFGGIEGGGTKYVCAVGRGPGRIEAELRFPTTTPADTLNCAIDFFRRYNLAALGVGSFGPIDPNPDSPTYGRVLNTPKPHWSQADVVGTLQAALGLPIAFDTDVNAAALAERRWGAAQGLDNLVYVTIGTGIGGGAVVNGQLVHGLLHPEMGHIRPPHDWERDPFPGVCPFHGDCLEGLAAGPALEARWGQCGEHLPADHPAWALEAEYLAHLCSHLICTLMPQRIILGGGVMEQAQLWPLIRSRVLDQLNGYVQAPAVLERVEELIVPPGLGNQAGVLGALALAMMAAG